MSRALGSGNGSVLFRSVALVLALSATAAALPAPARAGAPTGSPSVRAARDTDSLSDLPLKVVRPTPGDSAHELAVFLTGDGGWAAIDKEISDSLVRHGIPVVALNSREYLANKRTPERVASDVTRMIRHYGRSLGRSAVLLIGYSRGADILPFVVNRLPPDIVSRVRLIALLGLAPNANFKFHLVDLITNHHRPDDLPTVPEVARLHDQHVLCFYGVEEKEAACRLLPASVTTVVAMPGGHHFGGRYGEIATRILDALGSKVTTSSP